MSNDRTPTALVTGATSGLGLEAAAQLAAKGYGTIVVTGRTEAKAEAARDELTARAGTDVFETLALDLDDLASVEKAADHLAAAGTRFDLLVLNAGIAPTKELGITDDGLEATVASSLMGHHVLTMRLIERGLVADGARIAIAGSEAARGDVPMFSTVDIPAMAAEHFAGDLEAAISAQIRMTAPATYKPNDQYATAKLFVAWWAAELAGRLPSGTTVNAVSPGSTPGTNAARNAPFFLRTFMMPLFKLIPGMSHTVADGAARYLSVTEMDDTVTGRFLASRPKKMTGALAEIDMEHINDPASSAALWNVTTAVTGVGYPAAV